MKNSKENQQTWVIIPHLFSLFLWHSFSFSISSVVRHAHSLFHSLSIEWNVGGKLQNEIETSWESPKPSNQTPKEKRGTTKKYKIKKMSEKKCEPKKATVYFLLHSFGCCHLCFVFFMMIVMIWEWILFVLWIHQSPFETQLCSLFETKPDTLICVVIY